MGRDNGQFTALPFGERLTAGISTGKHLTNAMTCGELWQACKYAEFIIMVAQPQMSNLATIKWTLKSNVGLKKNIVEGDLSIKASS